MTEKQLNSPYFHDEKKGCETEEKIFRRITGGKEMTINGGYCKTHKVDLCRCGWQWGFHYGIPSKVEQK